MTFRLDEHPGTSRYMWLSAFSYHACPWLDVKKLLATVTRIVIVSPHPDDEVLAFGGFMQSLAQTSKELMLISVTDGSACFPDSLKWTRESIAKTRIKECAAALRALGWQPERFQWLQLGIPDTEVRRNQAQLQAHLMGIFKDTDLVLTTWMKDGHADHEATAQACASAAERVSARLIEAPVWGLHWLHPADERFPWYRIRKLGLGSQLTENKKTALHAFTTQRQGDESAGVPPVLTPHMINRACMPFEIYLA